MDPLSITASIVALLGATQTLIGATQKVLSICKNYAAAVKGADWELTRISEEVESLRGVLQGLERLAKQAKDADPAAVSQLPQLTRLCDPKTGTLALCLLELQTLERKLIPPGWTGESESKLRNLIQALGWPLKKAFVKETLGNLERFKASLNLDLVTIGVEGTVSVQVTANATQKEVLRVGKNASDFNASFRSMRLDDHTEKVLHWLSVLDPSVKYNKALEDRNAKTGNWLMEHEAFSEWKQTPASWLWLFGIPGCGKTILSSTVIKHLLDRRDSDTTLMVAYFYIDFSGEETQRPENMVRSLLKQICCQSHSAAQELDSLYSACANGTQQPTLEGLLSVSHGVLNGMKGRDTFFIIDALDECNERGKLLKLLEVIYERKHPKLHILVTSRQERDIEESLGAMTSDEARICIQSELVHKDILTYIQDRLENDNSLKRFKRHPKIQEKIRDTLIAKAAGMFRWVACQLDSFQNCLNPTNLEKALKSLPKTLDKTYERILCGIDEQNRDYARKILCWLTFSTRTLRLVEVAEVVAMDAREEPRFNPKNRFFDPKEILQICPSLVSVFTERYRNVSDWFHGPNNEVSCIKLAHFSVKEYLISVDIQKGPAKMYAISRELADISIAEACLALLLHFDKPDSLASQLEEEGTLISKYGLVSERTRKEFLALQSDEKFPLARYAANNWFEHARNTSPGNDFIGGLISEIFLKRDTLENWIRFYERDEPWYIPDLSKSSNDIGHAVYYASETGVLEPLKKLIGTGANINAPCGRYGNALQAASYYGHQEIVRLLLDGGADINAGGGKYGSALQAASYGEYQQIVKMLLDAGADANAEGGEFGNALQAASYSGYQPIVKMLLDKGADINTQGLFGNALQAASYRGHQQIIEMLLDAGADVNAQGKDDGNALYTASYWGHQQAVEVLLDAGADINAQGVNFINALQAASCKGHQQVVEVLLDAGADVNAQGGSDGNALQAASYGGYQQIIKMLLRAGADINAQGGEHGNALQAASYRGHQQIIKMLLDAGADVNAQGGKYGSALKAALCGREYDIAQILREHGAHEDVQSQENDENVDGLENDEDVHSLENDADGDILEINADNAERDGLQSAPQIILPAAVPQASQ